MAAPIYRGYSTDREGTVNTDAYDAVLVRLDLKNHFSTRLGERVRRPNHGSIIWDLLHELFDDRTEALVRADAERIVASDPRVKLLDMNVVLDHDAHAILVSINLLYKELNMTEWVTFTFTERNR